MGLKRIATVAGLVVVIVIAVVFVVRGRAQKPRPEWLLGQAVERMDVKTGEVITKDVKEWESLGHKDGLYKNPKSGDYTMSVTMICGQCGEKIPSPTSFDPIKGPTPCPKCGANPYSRPKTPRR